MLVGFRIADKHSVVFTEIFCFSPGLIPSGGGRLVDLFALFGSLQLAVCTIILVLSESAET